MVKRGLIRGETTEGKEEKAVKVGVKVRGGGEAESGKGDKERRDKWGYRAKRRGKLERGRKGKGEKWEERRERGVIERSEREEVG